MEQTYKSKKGKRLFLIKSSITGARDHYLLGNENWQIVDTTPRHFNGKYIKK